MKTEMRFSVRIAFVFVLSSIGQIAFADLLVVNKSQDSVSRIDTTSRGVLATFETGPGLHEIELSPQTRPHGIAWLSNGDELLWRCVVEIGLPELEARGTFLAGAEPDGMAWLPDSLD